MTRSSAPASETWSGRTARRRFTVTAPTSRQYPVPLLLVFALINRPEIFDLRPGGSLIEYLLDEGFDVFLVDWGSPDEEDAEMGLDEYVCDELQWAIRETLRTSGADELSLMGWCIGATLCAMYCGLDEIPARGAEAGARNGATGSAGRGGSQPGAADDADRRARVDLRELGRGSRVRRRVRRRAVAGRCPAARSTSPTRCSSR